VRIKLVALHVNRYTRSSLQFQKGWWPWFMVCKVYSLRSSKI